MRKTRIEKIEVRPGKGADRFCISCRRIARNRVSFQDNNGKLTVILCNKCAEKDYDELLLGNQFSWPGDNKFDK